MKRSIVWMMLVSGVCLAQEAGKEAAKGQEKPKAAEPAQKSEADAPKVVYPFFRDAEVKLMLDYYRPGSGHLPPGLVKKGEVPAALARQLRVTGTLPAALEKKVEPLPAELDKQLIDVPSGYRRGVCGTVALLVQDGTNLIVDALELIRRP